MAFKTAEEMKIISLESYLSIVSEAIRIPINSVHHDTLVNELEQAGYELSTSVNEKHLYISWDHAKGSATLS